MSASLVGSEMCIRDSFRTGALWRPTRQLRRSAAAAGRRRLPKGQAGAVSYTHLTLPTICSV
eukprot:671833-Alexandrium_andersonii.AAC.1